METQTLRSRRNAIKVKGKLSYSEGAQSWSVIRFKKELINEFPQLKEKRSAFGYKMVFYQSDYSEVEKEIRKLKKDREAIPILLWLTKERE